MYCFIKLGLLFVFLLCQPHQRALLHVAGLQPWLPQLHRAPPSMKRQESWSLATSTTDTHLGEADEIIRNSAELGIALNPSDSTYGDEDESLVPKSPTIQTWIRRLGTPLDLYGVHKVSGIGFVASSTAIAGAGAIVGFQTIPDIMEPLTYIFLASTYGQCVSAIRMAYIHRRNNVAVRDVFIATSITAMYQAFLALWIAPFAPSIFDDHFVSASTNAIFSITSLASIGYQVIKLPGVVARREMKKREMKGEVEVTWEYVLDVARFSLPLAWAFPFLIWTLFVMGIHDRQWFMDGCIHDTLPLAPHVDLVWAYYAQIFIVMAPMYAAFTGTLRDKKLISKDVELGLVALVGGVAALASVHGLGYI